MSGPNDFGGCIEGSVIGKLRDTVDVVAASGEDTLICLNSLFEFVRRSSRCVGSPCTVQVS